MFYADAFDFADPPQERFIHRDKVALGRIFRPFANKDPNNGQGIHTLEVTEYLGDQNAGLILWRWRVRGAKSIFGLPVGGRDIQTTGMSYHVYEHGKIVREITYSDQIHVALQLGSFPVGATNSKKTRIDKSLDTPPNSDVRH